MSKAQESKSAEDRKEKTTVYLTSDAKKRCDASMVLLDIKSRSEFFERAINFYSGYIHERNHSDYLSTVVASAVEGVVESSEKRLARMMFKEAVELSKLVRMFASINEMDDDELDQMHYGCVQEVKKINGFIRLEEMVREQASESDE
jgi:hypothetical protein